MKFLVGYDDSRVAEAALKLAREHARAFKAGIHLFTSLPQGPELQKEDIEEAESRLDNLKLNFDLDKVPCETHTSVSYLTPGEDLQKTTILTLSLSASGKGLKWGSSYSVPTLSMLFWRRRVRLLP